MKRCPHGWDLRTDVCPVCSDPTPKDDQLWVWKERCIRLENEVIMLKHKLASISILAK